MNGELTIPQYYGCSYPRWYKDPGIFVHRVHPTSPRPVNPKSREGSLPQVAASIHEKRYKISVLTRTPGLSEGMLWKRLFCTDEKTAADSEFVPVAAFPSEIEWMNAMLAERREFERQFPELLNRYRGAFVALYGGRVIASGSDPDEVHKQALNRVLGSVQQAEQESPPPILVKKCDESEMEEGVTRLPAVFRGCVVNARHGSF